MTANWKSPKLRVTAAVTKLYRLQQLHALYVVNGCFACFGIWQVAGKFRILTSTCDAAPYINAHIHICT